MSTIGKRKIWVGPADGPATHPLIVEGLAVSDIRPGTLTDRDANGLDVSDVPATNFAKEPYVAVETWVSTGGGVDVSWVAGETAQACQVRSGEFVNVLLAPSTVVPEVSTALSSNGDGTVKIAATDGSEQILFYSDEALTTTATAELICARRA